MFASYFIEYIRIYTVNCWFSNRNIVMYGIVLQCIVIVLYCWCCRRMFFFFFNIYLNYKKKEISITDWLFDVLFICSFNCFFFWINEYFGELFQRSAMDFFTFSPKHRISNRKRTRIMQKRGCFIAVVVGRGALNEMKWNENLAGLRLAFLILLTSQLMEIFQSKNWLSWSVI